MKKLADISAFESLCNGDNTRMYPPNPNQRAGLKTSREWAEEQGAKLQAGSIEELAEIMGDRYFMEYARDHYSPKECNSVDDYIYEMDRTYAGDHGRSMSCSDKMLDDFNNHVRIFYDWEYIE